jgi:hypothetical protein
MALAPAGSAAAAATLGAIAIAASVNMGAGTIGCPAKLRPCNAANIRNDAGEIIGTARAGESINVTGKAVDGYTPVKVGKIQGWIYSPYVEVKDNAKPE